MFDTEKIDGKLQSHSTWGPCGRFGRNLAYAEMRIVLARVASGFHLELVESSKPWLDNLKIFTLWQKDPLMVRLRPVIRG